MKMNKMIKLCATCFHNGNPNCEPTHWTPLPEVHEKEEELGCDHLDYGCVMGGCPDNEDES